MGKVAEHVRRSGTAEQAKNRLKGVRDFFLKGGILGLVAGIGFIYAVYEFFFVGYSWKDPASISLGLFSLVALALLRDRNKFVKYLRDIKESSKSVDLLLELSGATAPGRIREYAGYFAGIDEFRGGISPDARDIVDKLMGENRDLLKELANGSLKLPKRESAYANCLLVKRCEDSMDAVSDRDREFWCGPSGQEYLNESVQQEGKAREGRARVTIKVMRIFIFAEWELEDPECRKQIAEVLGKHYDAGTGFAVCVYEHLHPDLKALRDRDTRDSTDKKERQLDFALFDGDRAVTFFRKPQKGVEQFMAVFAPEKGVNSSNELTKDNHELIEGQRKVFVDLICECWLASERFKELAFERFQGKPVAGIEGGSLGVCERRNESLKQASGRKREARDRG